MNDTAELFAKGLFKGLAPDEVKAFLRDVGERMEPYIRDARQDCRPATGHYHRFEIR